MSIETSIDKLASAMLTLATAIADTKNLAPVIIPDVPAGESGQTYNVRTQSYEDSVPSDVEPDIIEEQIEVVEKTETVVVEEKPKRKRRSRKQIEEEKQLKEEAEEVEKTRMAEKLLGEDTDTLPTLEDTREALHTYMKEYDYTKAVALLGKYNAKTVNDIPEAVRKTFIESCLNGK